MNETHKGREPANQRHYPEKGCGMLGCACRKQHSWSGQEMCPAEDIQTEILYRDLREHRDCRGKKTKPKSKIKNNNNKKTQCSTEKSEHKHIWGKQS